jgi:hypothetical protein
MRPLEMPITLNGRIVMRLYGITPNRFILIYLLTINYNLMYSLINIVFI